jgi:hypothetical protein
MLAKGEIPNAICFPKTRRGTKKEEKENANIEPCG